MKFAYGASGEPSVELTVSELARLSGGAPGYPPVPDGLRPLMAGRLPGARTGAVLSLRFRDGDVEIVLRGTADAVDDRTGTVYEFVSAPRTLPRSHSAAHSSALMILACLYANENGLSSVGVCSALASPEGEGEFTPFPGSYPADALSAVLSAAVAAVRGRIAHEKRRAEVLVPALRKLPFPHASLRDGQRELIETVHSAVKRGERLFAQAPTGIGKTVSVLYGALRAAPSAGIRRIFYLTSKASTRREAFAAARRLSRSAELRTVILTAKEQICPLARGADWVCDPDRCPLMRNYAERSREAAGVLMSRYLGISPPAVSEAASAAGVCPYELSLDVSEYCDIIICDYNYVFDPAVRLRRYFSKGQEEPESRVFLIDEAHNLPDRARDMFSASLGPDDLSALTELAGADTPLREAADELSAILAGAAALCADNSVTGSDGLTSGWYYGPEPPAGIDGAVGRLCVLTERFFYTHRADRPAAAAAAGVLRKLRKWQDASDAYGRRYRTYISLDRGRVAVQLYCLDPSARLDAALAMARSSVFFSATLTPSDYFADVLGGGRGYMSLSLPSPFPRENLFVCAVTGIDTRLENRPASVRRLVYVIAAAAVTQPGNYIAFFPSYAYMEAVASAFAEKYPNVSIAVQKRGMSRAGREEFLSFFKDDTGVLRVGFCVLGGSFSEGVDLPGSRLIGAVIAGVGLPGLSAQRNMIRDYYDTAGAAARGYDYAYVFPGMNSVMQAAGRVIRRDTDRGVVILCDSRYSEPLYRGLMPPHWDGIRVTDDVSSLPAALREFWNGAGGRSGLSN